MKFKALIFATLLVPVHALAEDRQFSDGEAVTLQSDQAYILVRTFQIEGTGLHATSKFAPVLVRVLSQQELEQAKALAEKEPDGWKDDIQPNVVAPSANDPYAVKSGEEYLLTSLKPGEYILAGVALGGGLAITCLCMGTVEFEAKPGVVTDLGALLTAVDDEPTEIPELSKVVSGRPRGFGDYPIVVAVRPATPAADVPDALRSLPIVPANYRPVGAFPNYIGARISRLAPIPSVLDYDKDGNVVDLKASTSTIDPPLQVGPPSAHLPQPQ